MAIGFNLHKDIQMKIKQNVNSVVVVVYLSKAQDIANRLYFFLSIFGAPLVYRAQFMT